MDGSAPHLNKSRATHRTLHNDSSRGRTWALKRSVLYCYNERLVVFLRRPLCVLTVLDLKLQLYYVLQCIPPLQQKHRPDTLLVLTQASIPLLHDDSAALTAGTGTLCWNSSSTEWICPIYKYSCLPWCLCKDEKDNTSRFYAVRRRSFQYTLMWNIYMCDGDMPYAISSRIYVCGHVVWTPQQYLWKYLWCLQIAEQSFTIRLYAIFNMLSIGINPK